MGPVINLYSPTDNLAYPDPNAKERPPTDCLHQLGQKHYGLCNSQQIPDWLGDSEGLTGGDNGLEDSPNRRATGGQRERLRFLIMESQ